MKLVVEQTHTRKGHGHAVFVAAIDNNVIANRAAGLCNILDAATLCSLDVVVKREEGVRTQSNTVDGSKVSKLLLTGKGCRLLGKVLLPVALGANVLFVLIDVTVDDVVSVRTSERRFERQVQYLVVLTQEPGVGFSAGKACAMDTRLLSCSYADSLSVYCVADRVGLRILEGDKRDNEVTYGTFGKTLMLDGEWHNLRFVMYKNGADSVYALYVDGELSGIGNYYHNPTTCVNNSTVITSVSHRIKGFAPLDTAVTSASLYFDNIALVYTGDIPEDIPDYDAD